MSIQLHATDYSPVQNFGFSSVPFTGDSTYQSKYWNGYVAKSGNTAYLKYTAGQQLSYDVWFTILAINYNDEPLIATTVKIPANSTAYIPIPIAQATGTDDGKNVSIQWSITGQGPNSRIQVIASSSLFIASGIELPYDNEVAGDQTLTTTISWFDASQYFDVKIDGVKVTPSGGVTAYGLNVSCLSGHETLVEIQRIEGQEFAKELYWTFGSALHKTSVLRVNIPDKLDSNTAYMFPESGTLQLAMPDRSTPIDQWVMSNVLGVDGNIPPGEFTVQVRDINGNWVDMTSFHSDGQGKLLVNPVSATAVGLIDGAGQEVQKYREVRIRYNSGEMPQEPPDLDTSIPDEWDMGMSETDGEGSDDIETDEWDWIEEGGTTGTKPGQGQQQTGGESGGGGGAPVATCACAQHYIEIADTIRSGATYIGNTIRQAIYYNADETVKNIQALSDNLLAVFDKINNQLSKVQSRLENIDTDLIKASNQISDEINFLDDDLYGFREDFYDLTTEIRDGLEKLTESQFVQVEEQEKSITQVLQDSLPVISAALDNPNGLIQQEIYGDNGDGNPSVFTKTFKKGEF